MKQLWVTVEVLCEFDDVADDDDVADAVVSALGEWSKVPFTSTGDTEVFIVEAREA